MNLIYTAFSIWYSLINRMNMKKYYYTLLLFVATVISTTNHLQAQLAATGGSGPFGSPSGTTLTYFGPGTGGTLAVPAATVQTVDLGYATSSAYTTKGLNYVFKSGSWNPCQTLGFDFSTNNAGTAPPLGIAGNHATLFTSATTVNYDQNVQAAAVNALRTPGLQTTAPSGVNTNAIQFTGKAIVGYYGGSTPPSINNPQGCGAFGIVTAYVDVRVTLTAWTTAGAAINWVTDANAPNIVYLTPTGSDFYVNVL